MRHRNGRPRMVVETVPEDYTGDGTMYPGDRYEVWYVTCSCGKTGSGLVPRDARNDGCSEARMAYMRAKRRRAPSAQSVAAEACGMVKVRVNGRTFYE